MQAIIMAGGQGSRLRPLTCAIPKPLAPLCGRPVLEYIMDLLHKHDCERAALTLLYLGEKIEGHFDNAEYRDIDLVYCYEHTPLGTAGSVRNAADMLFSGEKPEDVLIISADAMCDFDLTRAMEAHKRAKADATIVVRSVDDPREYGLVRLSEKGEIEGFLEKPSYASCVTDLANTGVYILSPKVLNMIPKGRATDFAQDIFPQMLENGMRLFGHEETGYWCDIGDFPSYLRCQRDMLEGKVSCTLDGHRTLEGIISPERVKLDQVEVHPPVYIGRGVRIGRGTVIDAGTVIGDNVTVGGSSKLHGAVLLTGAYLGERVSCNDAVICENARMMQGSAAFEGSVVGENAVIGENAVVESGVRIWQGKQVASGVSASCDVKYGFGQNLTCGEESISGETNMLLTPEMAAKLGAAAASVAGKGAVAVSHGGGRAAEALAHAFTAGVMAAGGEALQFGECIAPVHEFCMRRTDAAIGAHIHAGPTTHVYLSDRGGIPLTRAQERKLEGCLNRGEYVKAAWNAFGQSASLPGMTRLYATWLSELVPEPLTGVRGVVKSPSETVRELLGSVLTDIGDKEGHEVLFHMTQNGRKCSAFTEETGFVRHEALVLLACEAEFRKERDVALPYSFPAVADALAKKHGQSVLRYYTCSCDGSDAKARGLARISVFPRDAMALALLLLSHLSETKQTLAEAVAALPHFAAKTRYIELSSSPTAVLGRLCREREKKAEKGGLGEGVLLREKSGRVLIRPVKTGRGLMVFAESLQAETAAELCDSYENLLRKMQRLDSDGV